MPKPPVEPISNEIDALPLPKRARTLLKRRGVLSLAAFLSLAELPLHEIERWPWTGSLTASRIHSLATRMKADENEPEYQI
jgi:hypothetical protein